jgi:EAL domain-containing protein (putative c-di-GMP-specific phosphodiesterase class I)
VGQVADIAPVADKLLAALAAPFVLEGREFFVTTSIGISLYPADGVDGQTLLKHADTAMYRAKDLGRNNYQFYSADLSAKAFERLTLETSLRRALERDEFLLYYQPQVDIRAQRLIGLEVLLRWRHPELGVVSPTQFIPVAEETGLIVPIGEWVLRSACAQARAWRAAGLAFGSITVNLSGRQFADPALAARIGQVLSDTGLAAGLLELEITESVVMHDPQSAVHTLEQLNAMGIRIAIDDFGTGYSSLAYLKRYPIDTLKVDQSFVRDVTHDPNDASIVQAIIAMARSMQLRVVAEGVETEEQLTFLRTHGCEAVQGYLFSRPVPAEEARELIARNRFSSTPARAR